MVVVQSSCVDVAMLAGLSTACSMSSCLTISSASNAWSGESDPDEAKRPSFKLEQLRLAVGAVPVNVMVYHSVLCNIILFLYIYFIYIYFIYIILFYYNLRKTTVLIFI